MRFAYRKIKNCKEKVTERLSCLKIESRLSRPRDCDVECVRRLLELLFVVREAQLEIRSPSVESLASRAQLWLDRWASTPGRDMHEIDAQKQPRGEVGLF